MMQAREAGAKFNWRPPKSLGRSVPPSGPTENRWALYSASSEKLESEFPKDNVKSEHSLLQNFKEDMAAVRKTSSTTTLNNRPIPPASRLAIPTGRHEDVDAPAKSPAHEASLTGPGAVLFDIVSALAGGLEMMGTELSKKLPEIERGIVNAQRDIPEAFHNTATDLLNMLERHDQDSMPAPGSQSVSEASKNAAPQNPSDTSPEGLFRGFNDLVRDIGDIGKAIFAEAKTLKTDISKQQHVESRASSSQNAPQESSSKVSDRGPGFQRQSTQSGTESLRPATSQTIGRTGKDSFHGCLLNCVIGANRSHENCVTKEPLPPSDDSTTKDNGKDEFASHFRLRGAQQTAKGLEGSRSRSPSAIRRNSSLHTKRSVNFVDRKGKIDRQEALNALKRHRSMISFHSRGKPDITTHETSHASIPEKSHQQNLLDEFDGRQTSTYNGSQRQSLGREEPITYAAIDRIERPAKPGAILDQEDSGPDFSVRYPSLLSNSQSENKRADGPRFDSNKSFLGDFNPESEIARYPTVSQLQRQAVHNQRQGLSASGQKPLGVNPPFPPPLKIPGSWPQQEADIPVSEESSGQFFDRMTGRTPGNHITRSKTVTASNPAARLPGPFDPLSDLAHTIREQKRRHAKHEDQINARLSGVSRAHSEKLPSSRRPYSETFTGAGRVPWESFVPSTRPYRSQASTSLDRTLKEPNRRSVQTFFGQPPEVELNIDEKAQARRSPQVAPQKDKFETCVDLMSEMGYGIWDPMEKDRLRLFAVAADGNVEAAVDMLEEEREASKTLGKRE